MNYVVRFFRKFGDGGAGQWVYYEGSVRDGVTCQHCATRFTQDEAHKLAHLMGNNWRVRRVREKAPR